MIFEAYIASRRVFSPKTDGPVNKLRHDLVVRGNLVYRYSRLLQQDYGMPIEEQVIDCALEHGVPAIPMRVDVDEKGTYQIMRRARGGAVAELPETQRPGVYAQLAPQLRKLHEIDGEGAGLIIDTDGDLATSRLCGAHDAWFQYLTSCAADHVSYATKNGLINDQQDEEIWEALLDVTINLEAAPMRLLHGDLNDWNVFAEDGKLTDILDWEDALIGDPIFELASWCCFTDHQDHWDGFLAVYYGEDARPLDFWPRFWVYYTRIALSRLVQLHRYGFTDLSIAQERVTEGLGSLRELAP